MQDCNSSPRFPTSQVLAPEYHHLITEKYEDKPPALMQDDSLHSLNEAVNENTPKINIDINDDFEDAQEANETDTFAVDNDADAELLFSHQSNSRSLLPVRYDFVPNSNELDFFYRPIGLANLGNTCYINSVLQVLAVCHPLVAIFGNEKNYRSCLPPFLDAKEKLSRTSFVFCFAEFLQYIYRNDISARSSDESRSSKRSKRKEDVQNHSQNQVKTVKAIGLTKSLIHNIPGFDSYGQQDAQETLIYILNHLHEKTKVPPLRWFGFIEEKDIHGRYKRLKRRSHPVYEEISAIKEAQKLIDLQFELPETVLLQNDLRFDWFLESFEISIINDTFQIITLQTVTCHSCGYSSRTLQECYDVSVPLKASKSSNKSLWGKVFGKDTVLLTDCLSLFFGKERMAGDDQYFCERCKQKRDATKTTRVLHTPEILTLHLNRHSHDTGSRNASFTTNGEPLQPVNTKSDVPLNRQTSNIGNNGLHNIVGWNGIPSFSPIKSVFGFGANTFPQKNNISVKFPIKTLDMNSFFHQPTDIGDNLSAEQKQGNNIKEREAFNDYELFGIIKHSGNLNGGHYISAIRNPNQANDKYNFYSELEKKFHGHGHHLQWFEFDDDIVQKLSSSDIEHHYSSDAFLLFYRRKKVNLFNDENNELLEQVQELLENLNAQAHDDIEKNRSRTFSHGQSHRHLHDNEANHLSETVVYVSRYYLEKCKSMLLPGKVSNSDIICVHGRIKPELCLDIEEEIDDRISRVHAIPRSIFTALEKIFGANEDVLWLKDLSPCELCTEEWSELRKRRRHESELASEIELHSSGVKDSDSKDHESKSIFESNDNEKNEGGHEEVGSYLVDIAWYKSWIRFLKDESNHRGVWHGVVPPGAISNESLLAKSKEQSNTVKLKLFKDYIAVTKSQWKRLHESYAGGPEIMVLNPHEFVYADVQLDPDYD